MSLMVTAAARARASLEYWTMGARVLETTVVNRAPLDALHAAKPLSVLTQPQLQRAVERALAYRRAGSGDNGVLTQRLRAISHDSDLR